MKALEDDLRIIAWISWGLKLLFKDYDLKEMSDFVEQTTNEELKKYFQEVDIQINDEGIEGVLLDKHFAVWKIILLLTI